jgi:hypothetical protein
MNEIQPLKNLEHRSVEVEPLDPEFARPTTARDPFASAGCETPPPPEARIVDRRVAVRHRAKEGRCWLGWHDRGFFRHSAAWIINISSSGALVATDIPPPADQSIWLRLDNPAFPEWAETRLVDLQESQAGIYAARIVFRGVCPYTLIKAVAFDISGPGFGPPPSWNPNAW